MLRYALTAATALCILSGAALAEDFDSGSKKVITRVGPNGVSKTIIRRHSDPYGSLVIHRRMMHEGMSGSSMTHSRTRIDPETGRTVTKTITHDR